jgi:hypothetical protein
MSVFQKRFKIKQLEHQATSCDASDSDFQGLSTHCAWRSNVDVFTMHHKD